MDALLDTPGVAARQSLYPELVDWAGMDLERANTGYNAARRVAGLLGPPLAGILSTWLGPSQVLWIDAATFAISAGIVALMVPRRTAAPRSAVARSLRPYLDDVREGFLVLRRDRLLSTLALTFAVGSVLAEPVYAVILPVYAREVLGSASELGLIFAALAAGSLLGNAAFALVGPQLPRRAILIGGFAIRAVAFWVLTLVPPWWVIAGAIFLAAIAFEPINPLEMTITQERIPGRIRARVFGATQALAAASLSLGILTYGFLLEGLGIPSTLFVLAIVNTALPLAMLVLPGLRAIPRPEPSWRQPPV